MTGFADWLPSMAPAAVQDRLASVSAAQTQRFLATGGGTARGAPLLFSAAARPHLEAMATRARAITLARFGRTMNLYAPLYLSNHCVNQCTYCGFAAQRKIPSTCLSLSSRPNICSSRASIISCW